MNTISLTMLLTEKCNLRCKYCYERFQIKASKPDQLYRILSFLERLSVNYDNVHISFFGGEPLLAKKHLVQIMSHCQKQPANFKFSLTTNGMLLSSEILKQLLEYGLDRFQITLDGLSTSHNQVRVRKAGDNTFEKIYYNLVSYKDIEERFTAVVRVNASPENSYDISLLATMLKNDFEYDGRYKTYIRPVGKWGGLNDVHLQTLSRSDFNSISSDFYSCIPEAMKYVTSKNNICYAAMPNHFMIYPNGSIGKCTVGIHDERNIVGKLTNAGHIQVDNRKLQFWSRGFINGDAAQLACPYHAPD